MTSESKSFQAAVSPESFLCGDEVAKPLAVDDRKDDHTDNVTDQRPHDEGPKVAHRVAA